MPDTLVILNTGLINTEGTTLNIKHVFFTTTLDLYHKIVNPVQFSLTFAPASYPSEPQEMLPHPDDDSLFKQ